jgi:hypothetical protein
MYEQWVWVEQDKDGTEGMIVAYLDLLGRFAPLAHRKEDLARSMQPVARQHAESSGNPVRLVYMREIRNVSGGR